MKKIFRAGICIGIIVLMSLLSGCEELEEPLKTQLVNLLHGSSGIEGDGIVYGLPNGHYIIKHQKKTINQSIDKAGKVRIWHDEDWYTLDADGSIIWAASTASDIPKSANNTPLSAGPANNVIKGLTNGESYTVYRYGELVNGNRVGRLNGQIATDCYNAFINLKNMSTNDTINLWETNENTGNRTGGLNDNNYWVVLVDTPLYWTEHPKTIREINNATIILEGYDYDIEISMRFPRGWVTVAPIEEEGQWYFKMTGANVFRGHITILEKSGDNQ